VLNKVSQYDIFNLTAGGRVSNLERQFEVLQNVFKQQLRTDSFDEFGLPVADMQRLIGRVININPEEQKLGETNVGLLNLNDENGGGISKIKLNLADIPSFSFFDGEIVVVEGTYDTTSSKLNVRSVIKPETQSIPRALFSNEELSKFVIENYKERAVQVMIACGPFTFKNSI
jgi:subtilase family serine protease